MLDFQQLKATVSIEQVLSLLSIIAKPHGTQLRTICPICKNTDPRGFVVTPAKNLYYCFHGCGGGDQIKLVSKMRNWDAKTSAQWIAEQTTPTTGAKSTPPQKEKGGTNPPAFAPLTYLEASHDALHGLGVSPDTLETMARVSHLVAF
jgi:DNA primase